MDLSRSSLDTIRAFGNTVPAQDLFDLPEKVLQFGTGVLLRALPDYFIDKANKKGVFNGRIAVVKSTASGPADEFGKQDGLYTIHTRGIENGINVDECTISQSISRVLSADKQWEEVLKMVHNPELKIIISNTTEIGIQLVEDDVRLAPPVSYPGRLLAVLYKRYKTFRGSIEAGFIIIPTELIVDNGKKLKGIVIELAHSNCLEEEFITWVEVSNTFCNSLVDRIVPGKPNLGLAAKLDAQTGYRDELRVVTESYRLWAIEGDEKVKTILSFAQVDSGVIITSSIEIFLELKLRLLNGAHTLSCAIAFLSGFKTVKDAMDDLAFASFIREMMYREIAQAIPANIENAVKADFIEKVLDRFRNPYIEHLWSGISAQYSSKLKTRVIPLLLNYYKRFNSVPENMAFCFAAFLRFIKGNQRADGIVVGLYGGDEYEIKDDNGAIIVQTWAGGNDAAVDAILKNNGLWDTDLTRLEGFSLAVKSYLKLIDNGEVRHILNNFK